MAQCVQFLRKIGSIKSIVFGPTAPVSIYHTVAKGCVTTRKVNDDVEVGEEQQLLEQGALRRVPGIGLRAGASFPQGLQAWAVPECIQGSRVSGSSRHVTAVTEYRQLCPAAAFI